MRPWRRHTPQPDVTEQLAKLATLRDQGALTDEQSSLSRGPSCWHASESTMRGFALHTSGVGAIRARGRLSLPAHRASGDVNERQAVLELKALVLQAFWLKRVELGETAPMRCSTTFGDDARSAIPIELVEWALPSLTGGDRHYAGSRERLDSPSAVCRRSTGRPALNRRRPNGCHDDIRADMPRDPRCHSHCADAEPIARAGHPRL